MKKKVAKYALLVVFIAIVVLAIFNTYKWIVSGEQHIKISTSNKAYTNSDLYVSIIAQDKGGDLETDTKIKLLNSDGKKVKGAKVSYDGSNAKISIPEIEAGNYKIRFVYEFGECSTTFIIIQTKTPPADSGNQDSSEIDKEPQPSIPSSPDDGSTSNNDNSTASSGCGSSLTACSILFILLFPLPFILRKKSRK